MSSSLKTGISASEKKTTPERYPYKIGHYIHYVSSIIYLLVFSCEFFELFKPFLNLSFSLFNTVSVTKREYIKQSESPCTFSYENRSSFLLKKQFVKNNIFLAIYISDSILYLFHVFFSFFFVKF